MKPNPYLVICFQNGAPIYAEAYETSDQAKRRQDELNGWRGLSALLWEGIPDGEGRPFYTEPPFYTGDEES